MLLINSKGTVLFCQSIGLLPKIFAGNWPEATLLPELNQKEFFTEFPDDPESLYRLENDIIFPDGDGLSYTIAASYQDLPGKKTDTKWMTSQIYWAIESKMR